MKQSWRRSLLAAGLMAAGVLVLRSGAACAQADVAPGEGESTAAQPRVALGMNVMQPAIYGLASTFFDQSYFIPIPLEAHVSINRQWGLATTLGYLAHRDGDFRVKGLWLALGPRATLVGNGLRGLYSVGKVGLAFRAGDDYGSRSYYRIGLVLQPELGYSLAWDPRGMFLAFGLGVLAELALSETNHPDWGWNGLGKMVNYYAPVVNITVGFDL